MGNLKFLSNTFDPNHKDAKCYKTYTHHAMSGGPRARDEEWDRHMEWINANVIGDPQATEKYSVEELKKMNLVGIYAKGEVG